MALFESFAQDVRYALRQLGLNPGFTTVAVLSLALGIGANTAIFQLVNAVRLRTLPVNKPEELVTVDFAQGSARAGWWSTRSARFTNAQWEYLRDNQQAFSGVMAWSAARFNLSRGGQARYAEGLYVSGEFFPHLGVAPVLGRLLTREDDTRGCGSPGAVLSYAFWQREMGGDPEALSRTIALDGRNFPVIGVTGPAFFGVEVGRRYDVAIPLCADSQMAEDKKGRLPIRHAWWLSITGRLKPGWTVDRADAHLKAISPALMQGTLPESYKPDLAKRYLANKLTATAGATGVSGLRTQYETPLWLLLATTALVLLIACANLANLLLARASVREREVAVRLAVGASRWRIVRQLLSESLVLSLMGAISGVGVAQLLSNGLVAFLSTANNPLFVGLGIDVRVLAFTSGVALITCVLFGLLPALRATQITPAASMRAAGRGNTAGRERFGLRRALVVTQVALSLVLLVGAMLFVRSLRNVLTTDAGFQTEGVLVLSLDLRQPGYTKERLPVVWRDLLSHLSSKPSVVSAAQVLMTPISGSGWDNSIGPDGSVAAASGKDSMFNRASPGYFKTMGTPILAGRDFTERDNLSAPRVAVVNETFAKKFFNGANPVGRTFNIEAEAGKPETLYQIVGLIKNTKYYSLREDFRPVAFLSMAQIDDPGFNATYVLKTAGSPAEIVNHVKAAVAEVSTGIGVEHRFLTQQVNESLLRDRLMATLSGSFGLLAGLLATIGLYGVIAYTVARRRNEIGVRMALGADRSRVMMLILREAAALVIAGSVVGILLAVWAGRTVASLLYGLQPNDPLTIAAGVTLLSAVALAASYVPARRAAELNPMTALREE